jgi:hypothetical protein
MNIAAVLGGWCAVSVVIGLTFGRVVRSGERDMAPGGKARPLARSDAGLVMGEVGRR